MNWESVLAPFGIQDMSNGELSLFFGVSYETSDFTVDCLEMWWNKNEKRFSEIEELVINLDNGPSQKSVRTQFIKRIVLFAKKIKIPIHLIYYPPYHSKYNPIEHSFGVLERFWNGAVLDTVETVLGYASNMLLNNKNPIVKLVDSVYEKGVTLSKKELKPFSDYFIRSHHLPKWDILVKHQ
jgi:transposase